MSVAIESNQSGVFPAEVNAALAYSVIVTNSLGNAANKGSGTYLGDGLYASAWHVVRDNPNGSITVTWKTGERYAVRVVASEPVWDIVLLESQERPQGGVPLTHTTPGIGAELYLAGYSQGPLQAWRGRAVSTSSPVGSQSADWMNATGGAISGDSGGPVLDSTGNYVGPLWGSSGSTTIFSNAGRFQSCIGQFRDRINNWHTQGYGCFGGQCPPQQYEGGGNAGYRPPPSGNGRVPVESNPGQPTPVQPPTQQPHAPPQQPNSGCQCERPQQPNGCDCEPDKKPEASACDPEAIRKAIEEAMKDAKGPKGDKGEIGLQGPIGPQGPRGPAGEITDEQLALIAASVYQMMQKDPKFRGPAGEVSQEEINRIKADVMAALPDIRVLLVDGSTRQVLDDETYRPGEPIVLDFQRVISAARQQ